MPRYSLRTLLILLAVVPPLVAPVILAGYRALAAKSGRSLDDVTWKPAIEISRPIGRNAVLGDVLPTAGPNP